MAQVFQRKKRLISGEALSTVILRLLTYLVILVFILIMGRIVMRGAPVLLREGISFITEHPQILHGFYDEQDDYHRLTSQEFRDYKKERPDSLVLAEKNANYSGGGVASPLVGTVLLILICIFLAMSIGIAAAVYLSEYAKRGPAIRAIRLAIINLA
ncbi:MAG: hypothetical protein AAF226_09760, partial [Verrucomicrobiota bacterium]